MTIEAEVAALTTATTNLLSAVNVSKTTLDQKVTDATTQADLAGTKQVAAATSETNAGTSATLSKNWATQASGEVVASQGYSAKYHATAADTARAAAVVAQNNAVSTVTGGTASLTAAASKIPISDAAAVLDPGWLENNQTFQRLIGGIAYATDLAGHAAGSPLVLTPGTPSGTTVGNPGNVAFDASYLYVCTAKNVWKRVALTAF